MRAIFRMSDSFGLPALVANRPIILGRDKQVSAGRRIKTKLLFWPLVAPRCIFMVRYSGKTQSIRLN